MSAPRRDPDRDGQHERDRWMSRAPARSLTPLVLAVAAAALLLHLLQNILLPFVIAAVVAYVCAPLVDSLRQWTRLPRWAIALGLLAVLMAIATLLGFWGLPPLLRQVQSVAGDLHGAVADFTRALIGSGSVQLLGSTLDAQHVADLVVNALQH